MSTITVKNAAELMSAFATAKDGDRIELAAGNYGGVDLAGRKFSAGVTITSADLKHRAVLTDYLNISNVAGVTVQGIDVDAAKLAPKDSYTRVTLFGSSNLTLKDMSIEGYLPTASEGVSPSAATTKLEPVAGYGYDVGVVVAYCTGVAMSQLDVTDVRMGFNLGNSSNLQIDNLDIYKVREGIDLHDVDDVMIENSAFHSFNRVPLDHPDMIQYWGTASTSGVHDLTIQNNVFWQDPNDTFTQTIYGSMMHAPNANVTATNFTIANNLIVNGQANAISLHGVTGVQITDNVLLPKADLPDDPQAVNTPTIVLNSVHSAVVSGNTYVPANNTGLIKAAASAIAHGDIVVTPDNVVLSVNPSSPLYWRNFDISGWTPSAGDPATSAGTIGGFTGGGTGSGSGGSTGGGTGGSTGGGTGGSTGGGTGTGPGGSALTTTEVDAMVKAFLAAGATLITGAAGDDALAAGSKNAVLYGNDGDDRLRTGTLDSLLVGGNGSDQFIFDMRVDSVGRMEVVADLDFAAGDVLDVMTGWTGIFSGATGGSVTISGQESRLLIDSVQDLTFLEQAGVVTITDNPGLWGVDVEFTDFPGHVLSLAGFQWSDF
jgi:hypothetical protein